MQETNINLLEDERRVAEALAVFLAFYFKQRPRAAIALSGGSTPKILFEHLAESYRDRIDWSGVHFFWVDESCVPPDHAESNYGMARKLLLDPAGVPAANVHRVLGEAEAKTEKKRYAEEIRKFVDRENGLPAFDIVLLGLGDDGHTASIFPDQLKLLESRQLCATARHPASGQKRITLTGPVINNARNTVFLATGAGKADRVREIIMEEPGSDRYPAAHVRPGKGRLFWFIDDAAAAGIPDWSVPLV